MKRQYLAIRADTSSTVLDVPNPSTSLPREMRRISRSYSACAISGSRLRSARSSVRALRSISSLVTSLPLLSLSSSAAEPVAGHYWQMPSTPLFFPFSPYSSSPATLRHANVGSLASSDPAAGGAKTVVAVVNVFGRAEPSSGNSSASLVVVALIFGPGGLATGFVFVVAPTLARSPAFDIMSGIRH